MKLNRYISAFALPIITAAALSLQAATVNLPVVEVLGTDYYLYEAKKGDSLFGIAREYGWDDELLQRLNPSVVSPLKKGMKIYYPVKPECAPSPKEKTVAVPGFDTDLVHKVAKGETVYSISRMYNIPVEHIYSLNSGSRNGIKGGETLLLKKASSDGEALPTDRAVFYTIKPGDTLYKVARMRGVSVEAIMKSNPGVSETNFKADEVIKLPPSGTGVEIEAREVTDTVVGGFKLHKVDKDETWRSIARKNGVDVEELRSANPDVKELKKNVTVAIPDITTTTEEREVAAPDPRELTEEGIGDIYQDVHKVDDASTVYVVKVAVVSETPNSNKDQEFLRGFLTGINRLKREKYKIDLKVVDGTKSGAEIVEELDEFCPTVVFSTNDRTVSSTLAEYAETSRTPLVNTFDIKSEAYTSNPYIIQLLTPSNYFNETIATHVADTYKDYTLIMAGEEDESDLLAAALAKHWDSTRLRHARDSKIAGKLGNPEGKYLIYGTTVKKTEIQALLEDIEAARQEAPFADIVTLGRPNWIQFDEALEEVFHKGNTVIPSRFYIDKESTEARRFQMDFKQLFNRTPVKSVPLYAAVGYDTAGYFIPQLADARGDINTLESSRGTVQSDFDLKRVSNWGGFVNPPVYLVKFTTFGTIDKNVIE